MIMEAGAKEKESKILVCLSASPSNQKVIRSAAKYCQGNSRTFTALYVDNERRSPQSPVLQRNMAYAKSLGASVEVVIHKDILTAIVEYAGEMGITDLFIGYSGPSRRIFLNHLPVYRLVHHLPDVDVHIIPDAAITLRPSELISKETSSLNKKDFFKLIAIMAAATILSALFDRSKFSNGNIITIYILAVLLTSVTTAESVYGILAAVLYILLFNFLFIDPRFSFLVYDPYYMVTYFVSILAAVITGNISSRMKQSVQQARINAYQAQILLNTSELLQKAEGTKQIMDVAVVQLRELLGREIVFYSADEIRDTSCGASFIPRKDNGEALPEGEAEVIRWAFDHSHQAGWGTKYYSGAQYRYLSVRTGTSCYGVIGVESGKQALDSFEENILLSLIGEFAMSLEAERNRTEREEALIVAENERFRSKLLRSISHDLRTPLTSISGNAANLLSHEEVLGMQERKQIYSDIYEDSIWLIDIVENLLAITRLEEHVELHMTGEVVADVLSTAVCHAKRHKYGHQIILDADEECLIAQMDVSLILQVMNNLIGNAVKHTPDNTTIRITDWKEQDRVMISIADDGPGIPDEEKEDIFRLFYTGKKAGSDSSRSLGLGLNLCRSIINAHGQDIHVEDNRPSGTVFIFSLRLWEESSHETVSDIDR